MLKPLLFTAMTVAMLAASSVGSVATASDPHAHHAVAAGRVVVDYTGATSSPKHAHGAHQGSHQAHMRQHHEGGAEQCGTCCGACCCGSQSEASQSRPEVQAVEMPPWCWDDQRCDQMWHMCCWLWFMPCCQNPTAETLGADNRPSIDRE